MNRAVSAALLACWLATPAAAGDEWVWENPVFDDAEAAVRAATAALADAGPDELGARELFTRYTLSATERPGDPRFTDVRRRAAGGFLVTFPSYLEDDAKAAATLESFLDEVEFERARLTETLERFAFPRLPGLIFVRLIENVEELQDPGVPASERTFLRAGRTYFCRYVLMPLSYITPQNLEDLHGSLALDPDVDVAETLKMWEDESLFLLRTTFRHELVHVWTHSSIGPPAYRDRERYPRWFIEGSASYLTAQPYSGLSEEYQGFQSLFLYLVERHGVAPLHAFFGRLLAGASAREGLYETFGIADGGELRAQAERWHGRKDGIRGLLVIVLLVMVVAAIVSSRVPVSGALQLWAAVTLAYGTFSGFCDSAVGLDGAAAVIILQAVLAAGAVFFAALGVRSLRRVSRRREAA